jgi:EAL domain-containing protein (putative c-di-GMP-specific phosphodiesterase class I)
VDDQIIEDMERRAQIEHALVAAIESHHFEVHYQPIFDAHSKKFHSMEALARLQVPGYGYVSPEEFILVAEQNGTILKVGLLVLEEVCRFINEYDLREKGIRFIEVNLSVVQCMQERLYEELTGVLKKYKIAPDMINLEITESVEAYSEERLVRNMARLSLTDITFSLDDYGSGYSNINYLVDLPFSLVKIDKYIVWAAMKKVSSRRVLENTIAMFKDINLKVVTEGIENPDMMNMVIDMGADYLQGYYFSKPVTKEKLVECLEEGYLEKLLTE